MGRVAVLMAATPFTAFARSPQLWRWSGEAASEESFVAPASGLWATAAGLVHPVGLEPTRFGLKGRRSTS